MPTPQKDLQELMKKINYDSTTSSSFITTSRIRNDFEGRNLYSELSKRLDNISESLDKAEQKIQDIKCIYDNL